jgi:glycosyltransferase involved in cell wall biosynthesis
MGEPGPNAIVLARGATEPGRPAPSGESGARRRPLRVGLNLIFLGKRAGGSGRYARELVGALLAVEPATEIHLFVSRDAPADLRDEPWAQAVQWVRCPVGIGDGRTHLIFQFTILPLLAASRRVDVLHSLANLGPAITPRVASVVSLLDLIWMLPPAEWGGTPRGQRSLRGMAQHSVRHADRVFAISQAGAEDIIRSLDVPAERIDITPLGVNAPSIAPAPDQEVRALLDLSDRRVVLCVAQKRPYKNLHRLVRALPALNEDVMLVLPGAPTEHERELRTLAAELGVGDRVRFPDWLSEEQLEGLYALSSVFVLPSLIEGFGLPVLEAMLRGVPVACSGTSALGEVAGDAALTFDPKRQEEVTAAIRRLLDDRDLAAQLVTRGLERARAFTWRRTGELSFAGYRRAIVSRSGQTLLTP